MKASSAVLAGLAGLYALLWAGGVISYLFLGGPPADAAWTAPSFLALAAVLTLAVAPAGERWILLAAAAIGFAAEAAGVAWGIPFGRYRYTATLFPHVAGVPVVMAAAWLVLFAYLRQMPVRPVAAAAWMTAIDLVIDPLAVNVLDYWTWEGTGPYYGIPWSNFAGWFIVSLALFSLPARRAAPQAWTARLGLSVVLFFTVIALGTRLWLAGGVGLALVILHAALGRAEARRSRQSTAAVPPGSPDR